MSEKNKDDEQKFIAVLRHEVPQHLQKDIHKAKHLEWITIAYLSTVVVLMYLVLGSSQAMKTAWLEDILSLVPAISFLIAYSISDRKPTNHQYPYGLHKVFTVAYLIGAVALLAIGLYAFVDSCITLFKQEKPTIGNIRIFGEVVWMGWVMIAALVWSFVPAMILGRMKLPLSKKLHNKILYTDAQTQKADWMTAVAAMAGILGIGMGIWWADAAAAIFISISILSDGYKQTRGAIKDIMEQVPTRLVNDKEKHPLNTEVYEFFKNLDWVKDVRIRLREHGMIFFGEAFVIPQDFVTTKEEIIKRIEETYEDVRKLDWKIHDIVIEPVRAFWDDDEEQE